MMKKSFVKVLSMVVALGIVSPVTVSAENIKLNETDLASLEQAAFESLIDEIQSIKERHPEYTDEQILQIMDAQHPDVGITGNERGVSDIWNVLTNTEKQLCIRYPFAALKVNKAKDIAATQTEAKFGTNGLGDRSDAFRHGIWNAEMTILIGKEKAELFASAHEDKDVIGNELDGYPKTAHRDMDLHNNEIGRSIGTKNINATEDELANTIYDEVHSENTQFIWLHE